MDQYTEQTGIVDRQPRRSARAKSGSTRKPQGWRGGTGNGVRGSDRAERLISFIEKLIVPSGTGQGETFKLRQWQRDFIFDVYGVLDEDDHRLVRRAILSIARKNGKSALIAALALAHLVGPEHVINGEIYSAANDRFQAAQVFKMAAQMVRASPTLSRMIKISDSVKTMTAYHNGSFYQAISAEAGTKHGMNPSMVIYDELAQAKNNDLYDVLDTGFGARQEPLFITISTQSNDPQHILSVLIDDGINTDDPTVVCHLFSVPEDVGDIFDESVWVLANPALGDFLHLEDMRAEAAQAQRVRSAEPRFRNLRLNQRVSPRTGVVDRTLWNSLRGEAKFTKDEAVYLGLDLSSTTDLTALAMISVENGDRVKVWFWKPEDWLEIHGKRDRVDYTEYRRRGILEATEGRTVKKEAVAIRIAELTKQYDVRAIAYDRWRIDSLLIELDRIGLEAQEGAGAGLRLVPWGQGFKDMGPAVEALQTAAENGTLEHDGSPLLATHIANAVVAMDAAGEQKLDKSKSRLRIDGAQALAMAVGLKARDKQERKPEYQMLFVG